MPSPSLPLTPSLEAIKLGPSAAQFQAVIDSEMIGMVFWDAEGEITQANDAFLRLMECTREDVAEGRVSWRAMTPPEFKDVDDQALIELARTGTCTPYEKAYIRKDGSRVPILIGGALFSDQPGHGVAFILDITERKKAESAQQVSDVALKSISQGVIIADRHQIILSANDAFSVISGYSKAEIIGKNCRFLQGPRTDRQTVEAIRHTLTQGAAFNGEILNYRKDGSSFWNDLAISPVRDTTGQLTHFIGITRDITERKTAERERSELLIQLQLAQKLEAVGKLSAGIAHEINTPVQFISSNSAFLTESFAQLTPFFEAARRLRDAAVQHPELALLAAAFTAAEKHAELDYLLTEIPTTLAQNSEGLSRITRILKSLKEFAHPQNAELHPADLNHVIATAITVSQHEWNYAAEVVTDFAPDLPLVPCVIDEFNQVVLHLLINAAHAIEAAEKSRAAIPAKGTITVRTRLDGDWALIEVVDTGTGIPETTLPRIFDPFFTTKEINKGTGQGLTVVHSVITKKHQGSINVSTRLGHGSTFQLRLPIAAAE